MPSIGYWQHCSLSVRAVTVGVDGVRGVDNNCGNLLRALQSQFRQQMDVKPDRRHPAPVVVAGVAGVFSKRWAKRWLPIAAAVYAVNGLMGQYFHARGVSRRPGGWRLASYNVPMGPPIAAPGLMSIVGAMGLLAAILRREK
jgi:hypothetical protein